MTKRKPYVYRLIDGMLVRVFIDRYNKIYRAESAGAATKLKLKWEATER